MSTDPAVDAGVDNGVIEHGVMSASVRSPSRSIFSLDPGVSVITSSSASASSMSKTPSVVRSFFRCLSTPAKSSTSPFHESVDLG